MLVFTYTIPDCRKYVAYDSTTDLPLSLSHCSELSHNAYRNEKLYLGTFAMAIVYMGSLVAVMVGSCEALGEWAGFSVATLGLTFVAVGARPSRITLPCLAWHMSGLAVPRRLAQACRTA